MQIKKCIDCKYCSYNVMLDEYRKRNWFSRFVYYLTKGYLLEVEFKHPKCLHEKVYRKSKQPIDLVHGKDIFNPMFCGDARTNSYKNDRVEYNCCQFEGRYFQHK